MDGILWMGYHGWDTMDRDTMDGIPGTGYHTMDGIPWMRYHGIPQEYHEIPRDNTGYHRDTTGIPRGYHRDTT